MRAIFSVIGLLVAVAAVGLLVKKQLPAHTETQPKPPGSNTSILATTTSGATVQQQSLHIQQQISESVEAALQQTRAVPDDK